ncbi:MAG: RHS repeat-associated core domain-containing protein, partial [Planctomycetota bacterium]
TTTESFQSAYFATGEQSGRLQYVTLRRKVDAGAWDEIRRAAYEYYGGTQANGSLGDLQRVKIQLLEGITWKDLEVHYYRYYQSGDAQGTSHDLKFVVSREAYQQLAAAVADPLTATDAQVALYADHYFEYDVNRRVVNESVDAASRTYTFSYTTSTHADGYNNWKRKTVETQPDGSQNIVYTNYLGQILIRDFAAGTNRWIEYHKYDAAAHEILRANPSAVSDYDDTFANLNVSLNASAGFIRVTDYYSASGGGAAKGYVQFAKIKQGDLGSEIKLRAYEYTSRSAGGTTIFPVSKQTEYRHADGTGAVDTSYSDSWFTGSVQMQERAITLPAVPTSQNGSGVSATRTARFDQQGNLIWLKDERGFITRHTYDVVTGARIQTIEDVDTTQVTDEPAGWVTPSGGGLHLVTDFEHDELGQITQELGPPHSIDLADVATTVRTATWTVYKDLDHEVWSAKGYATGAAPNYTCTLVNPVRITKSDKNGNVTEQIAATRGSGVTDPGKLQPTDSFPRSSYVRWTTHQYIDFRLPVSTREYHTIPATGDGVQGTNYNQRDFGYDSMKRQNRQVTPGGTISFDVLDVRDRTIQTYIGTDDSGATESDPTGGGAPGNNMVQITGLQYDDGNDGGNSNLTQQTQYVDDSTTRVTSFEYDWRDRRTTIDGEEDLFQKLTYDNLDHVVKTERYDTTASGNLVALSETRFDDRGRLYQSVRFGVDPATGSVGNSLTDNTWFDAAGNPIKQLPAGSSQFTKTAYDSLGRGIAQYQGYDLDETSYADAGTVNDDTIIKQSETTYDSASNAIEQITRQRYHNAPATQTGTLQSPSLTPNARVTYTALYPDATGRKIATANFGTNGGAAFTRPATVPSRSDTVLVTTTAYNNAGETFSTTDPAGKESRTIRDAMSRNTSQIENYQASGSGTDVNVTTEFTYTADSQIKTLTAKMSSPASDEVTTYVYGVSPATGSQLTVNNLLLATEYPEDTSTKREEYAYNRQQERIEKTDQNGTVHGYDFDGLGRQTQDRITTVGTGVDSAVRRVETSYDVRGQVDSITSLDNAIVGSGSVLNQSMMRYDDFGQLSTEFIAHSGMVNTSTSPKIQYSYADGSSNQTRLTSVTYPGGREIDVDYGTSGGIDDSLSRVQQLIDGATTLVDYNYLGLGAPVQVSYPQPDVTMDLWDETTGTYAGLDRFGRIIDLPWIQDPSGTPTDLARIKYGYNRPSSPTYARDEVARAASADLDQLYSYDGLQRLLDFQQGQLNAGNTAITSSTLTQDWDLDQVGNWDGFNQGVSGVLNQTRTHNRVNEITDISNAVGQPVWTDPAYDDAGNMTLTPRPNAPTEGFTLTYDAWNRITKVETTDSTPKLVAQYGYDGRKHRISKEVYDAAGSLKSTTQ